MKRICLLLTTAILTLTLYSCQKEITGEPAVPVPNPIPTPVPPAPKAVIDQIFLIDSIFGVPVNDTVRTINYVYDGRKRVTAILEYDVHPVLLQSRPENGTFYFYNGNDTIPNRTIRVLDNGNGAYDSSIIYHGYDASLRRVYDSTYYSNNVTGGISTKIDRYTYTANAIYVRTYNNNNPSFVIRDTTLIDNRGNLIFGKKSSYTFDYEFDSRINPFTTLTNFKALNMVLEGEDWYYFFLLKNTNNITAADEDYGTGPIDNPPFIYTYLPNGFPQRSIQDFDFGEFEIIAYKYKLL